MFERIIEPQLARKRSFSIKTGLVMGLNELIKYCVMAGFFWIGASIIIWTEGSVKAKDVFSSIFILMFSLMNAGGSAANAPDVGKAKGSVERVFDIVNHPSPIDATADDNNVEKVRLDLSKVKG